MNRSAIIHWLLVILWAAFIFFMSAKTGTDLAQGDDIIAQIKRTLTAVQESLLGPGVDAISPIAHFLEYTVLGALVYLALKASGVGGTAAVMFAIAVAICAAYAATDEFHQYFVPDRTCDPMDWVVDVTGSALGTALAMLGLRACTKEKTSER